MLKRLEGAETDFEKDGLREFPLEPNLLVSRDGKLYSRARYVCNHKGCHWKERRPLKSHLSKKGYERINFVIQGTKKTITVHRIVALTYIHNPEPIEKPQINHKDGNKLNNTVENLEWCSNAENHLHKCANGLNIVPENAGKPKKKVRCIDTGVVYESVTDCARQLNYSNGSNIGAVCRGVRPHVLGMKFEFVEES
ncbi:HNH endonuclease [Bacillus phage Z3]|nr:HNH endonuclease [Bacillus phage Z3]